MKTKQVTALALVLFLSACAKDVVIQAEVATRVGNDTMDAFVHLERDNELFLKGINPQIHNYANVIRRNGITWLKTARAMTEAYKQNRTPENKANLDTALSVLNTAIQQSQNYIVLINSNINAKAP